MISLQSSSIQRKRYKMLFFKNEHDDSCKGHKAIADFQKGLRMFVIETRSLIYACH